MLDINLIRENSNLVKKGIQKKNADSHLVDDFLNLDADWRGSVSELDNLRSLQKKLSEERRIEESRELKDKMKHLESDLRSIEEARQEALLKIPNLPLEDVPVGKDESENVVLREVGKKPSFDFEPKDHLTLGEELGIIDFEKGAKVSGSGFYFLKNEAALLELALVCYAFDFLRTRGFSLFITPDLAREKFYLGTGYLPKGPEAQTYKIEGSDLGLVATAEVTLAAMHADEVFEERDLPRRYLGFSHCFRQEGGSYGKYSRGLYRVHQFSKVEMFAYTIPEESAAMHEEFLKHEEDLWQSLGIPYRVLLMCTGDLGGQAAKKYDLEAWLPGRGDWGEVTSTSNTTDYQARNLNIKFRRDKGTEFAHMLNGTAFALSRAIIAILENCQQKDGSIVIPEVLRKYTGFDRIARQR